MGTMMEKEEKISEGQQGLGQTVDAQSMHAHQVR